MAHQHHSAGQQGSAETAPLEKAQELSPGGRSDQNVLLFHSGERVNMWYYSVVYRLHCKGQESHAWRHKIDAENYRPQPTAEPQGRSTAKR